MNQLNTLLLTKSNNETSNHLLLHLKQKKQLQKMLLITKLNSMLQEMFQNFIECSNESRNRKEQGLMDNKIIQKIIQEIIETGEYNLEGIAFHTRIPFDVIFDAACGLTSFLSISSWTKIIDLYLQVKPDISKQFIERLSELSEKNQKALNKILNES